MRRLWWGALALLLAASSAPAQKLPWQKSERPQDVHYLFPEQVSVKAGKDSVVELHFRINPGMHINSHTPSEKGLIATNLILPDGSGVKLDKAEFPAGSEYSLRAMPSMKLNVYTGDFVVRAHIRATSGQHLVQGSLRYQACDVNACYPPRKAPVVVDVIAK
ncbi:MAG TPA: protein-disulfide reductase DsbD domain-containing protein [Acidobacteriaceae bacterium]|nr:protein-disulfide reductase DsbD domain-containing protein [Acidobacteriaceae bacterium]